MWKAHNARALPSFVIIGADGKVVGACSGEGKEELLDFYISSALQEGKRKKLLAAKIIKPLPLKAEKGTLSFPGKIEIGVGGKELFISDSGNNRILRVELVSPDKGKITAVIGNGNNGLTDGVFESAEFNKPQGMTLKESRLYVADTENHAIREIDLSAGTVKTVCGRGVQGQDAEDDNSAQMALLNSPWDVDISGDYLYIAMAGSHQIWRMHLSEKTLEVFAGSGEESLRDGIGNNAQLAQPSGLSVRGGVIYFVDSETSSLRSVDISSRGVLTHIGSGLFIFGMNDGAFYQALLQHPIGVYAESAEKVYIADAYNNAIRSADITAGRLRTVIYARQKDICSIDDKDCDALPLAEPNDVVLSNGLLYIADTNNHLIRVFDLDKRELKDLILE